MTAINLISTSTGMQQSDFEQLKDALQDGGVELTACALSNANITGIKQAVFNSIIDDGNSSTADTIDLSTGSIHKSTLTGNCTYTFTAPTGPSRIQLFIYTGSGSFAVVWPGIVKWPAGVTPIITTTASKVDIATFFWDGAAYWGSISQNYTA